MFDDLSILSLPSLNQFTIMVDSTQLSTDDIADFIAFMEDKVEKKREELKALETRLAKFKASSNGGGQPAIDATQKATPANGISYNPKWTLVQKINFMLMGEGKTTTQIVDAIIDRERELFVSRAKLVGSISAILSARSKPGGKYTKIMNERNVGVYSLK